jgi:rare lipoprotein A
MSSTASRITTLAAAFVLAAATPALAQEAAPTGGSEATVGQPGLTVSPGALLNRTLAIRGQVADADAGRTVRIERQMADGAWQQIASTVVAQDGRFAAPWRTDSLGRVALRAIVDRGDTATASSSPLTAQTTVFQGAVSSWYGPGFWGRRTACGIRLRKATVGVAHRTLPCGTKVEVFHRGRSLVVPVIDRGPFANGAHYDLTAAAAQALGFRTTGRIGVAPRAAVAKQRKRRS